jgi:hypothetical protein
MIPLLFLIPLQAFADEGEDAVKALGWTAIGIGVLANIPFIIYNRVRKLPVKIIGTNIARELALLYKPVLNAHIALNIIGYIAGAVHGLLLVEYLEPISLSLAIVMSVLVVSGLLLRYTSSRNLKVFNRLMHGQAFLALLLIVLIGLHIATAED